MRRVLALVLAGEASVLFSARGPRGFVGQAREPHLQVPAAEAPAWQRCRRRCAASAASAHALLPRAGNEPLPQPSFGRRRLALLSAVFSGALLAGRRQALAGGPGASDSLV